MDLEFEVEETVKTTETFAAEFARHAAEKGYRIRKIKDLVRLSAALGLTVPATERLAGGDADLITDPLAEKLATAFETESAYWTAFKKKHGNPQLIEGVPYRHEISYREIELSNWPHAALAIQLARDIFTDDLVEIDPNLWIGRLRVKE